MTTFITLLIWILSLATIYVGLYVFPFNLWLTAVLSGIRISPKQITAMRVKNIPPKLIIDIAVMGKKGGIKLSIEEMTNHYLAAGNVSSVVASMISAKKHGIVLKFDAAAKIDLGGQDVLRVVQIVVNPETFHVKSIAELPKTNTNILLDIAANIKFKGIDVSNYSYLTRIKQRITEIAIDILTSSEETYTSIKEKPSILINHILQKLKYDDIGIETLELRLASINEISEAKMLALQLPKGFGNMELENPEKIKVGETGIVWSANQFKTAVVFIDNKACKVNYSNSKIVEQSEVIVTEVKNGEIFVDFHKEIEY